MNPTETNELDDWSTDEWWLDKGHELKPRKRYGRESRYCPTCQRDAARQRKASA
ncbi:hypothetical protein FDH94_gp44 [Mycobacterium phage Jebeks]|uniref:HNH endonuclease n=1 Tax=Mycobacterium phage Jebeks TaxID=1076631 RepID=A0A2L1ISV6_9CAUD|nr:hypothetical protein FDH94_gp44 [Mycobacterium phage Jebeks]AVD98082.1 hypothetical protein SEA_JEBEKS_45 [Mycobacterium phage Jebeks]